MSPETGSSLFPDRPIHPLPKRRLRERLSPEVADSIQYPPTPTTASQLFPYPYNVRDEDADAHKGPHRARTAGSGEVGRGLETEEEDPSRSRRSLVPRSAPSIGRPGRPSLRAESSRQAQQAPSSAGSSVDGHDPPETNNKKKRKVPESALGAHSLSDASPAAGQAAPSTPSRSVHSDNGPFPYLPYRGMGTSGSGMSGPGRGRFAARNRGGRSPLSEGSRNTPSSGIISNAIARVEKYPPQQGQENVSLLQLQQSSKSKPASGPFTFTCESQVPGTAPWPQAAFAKPPSMASPAGNRPAAKPSKPTWTGTGQPQGPAASVGSSRPGVAAPQATTQKKPRRRPKVDPNREYFEAAAQRKRQMAAKNAHFPPKPEDVWICHFCEYEAIFGEPPEALIRQYEIKDLKKRKEEENRRKMLEKAKAKGRKNKKNSKAAAKGAGASQVPPHDYDHEQDYAAEDAHDGCDEALHGHLPPDKHGLDTTCTCGGAYEAEQGCRDAKPPDITRSDLAGTGAGRAVDNFKA